MHSCIYEGQVRHTRTRPVLHRFRYRMFMMYLDLGELPSLFEKRWFWSSTRPAIARFRRGDHIGSEGEPLDEAVRNLVEKETGRRPLGSIRLLTNLSYFGYCFNPVSFYYCFADDGDTLEAIVAEVTNTPWGERDTYVLPVRSDSGQTRMRFRPTKKMHVSPFIGMDIDYDWCFTLPTDRNSVYMANSRDGTRFFDAAMTLRRREISGAALAGVLVRFPFITLKIITAIYWQALRLWLKRCPLHAHPEKNKRMAVQ